MDGQRDGEMDGELLVSGRQQRLEEGEGDGDGRRRAPGTRAPRRESEGCGVWPGWSRAGGWQPEGMGSDSIPPSIFFI